MATPPSTSHAPNRQSVSNAHLLNTDDHSDAMAALGAMAAKPVAAAANVIPLHG